MEVFSAANLKSNWTIIKFFKVGLAALVLFQAWESQQAFLGVFAGFFLVQTVLNIGCGSAAGCAAPLANKLDKNIEDITFTEVKPTNKEK
ncbi:MAG: hypothetical protein ACOVK9_00715 [Bacteroidia bacterium]|jgi:hypothetical protein